ncbi:MAG TPA: hypothetical protein PKX78_02630 [Candidatus Woesebacteria bacterium]|nr:hypothetical protein [Candidatus Woesebacteria bacterium]
MSSIKERAGQQKKLPTGAELKIAIDLEKSQFHDLTPVQKVATLMHVRLCTGDHCDQGGWHWECDWYATNWETGGSTREYYLRRTEKFFGKIGDPQIAIDAAEILLGKQF